MNIFFDLDGNGMSSKLMSFSKIDCLSDQTFWNSNFVSVQGEGELTIRIRYCAVKKIIKSKNKENSKYSVT